jgi:triosephosphate isomerase (TIM)
MRRKIVAGNWKMNKTLQEGLALTKDIADRVQELPKGVELILIPSFIHQQAIGQWIDGVPGISLGAQDLSANEKGAFTGDISPEMLISCGTGYVLVGHSERRNYHSESDELVGKKLRNAVNAGLSPILCVGEELKERYAKKHNAVVEDQLNIALDGLSARQMRNVLIAYEPVWAIGTGETASAEQAQDMHAHIRSVLEKRFGPDSAQTTPILYGGSCNPGNAGELFAQPDVDGGLIGGASLKADDFLAIAKAF